MLFRSDFLLTAAGKAEAWPDAKRILADARPKIGDLPLLCQALALVEARLGDWNAADTAATKALEGDARLEDARKVRALAQKHLSAQ